MAGESVIMSFLRSQEEKQNQNGQQEKQIVYIDIEDLEASKENFYGLRDLEALKASISLHGLLQPILVIPAKIEGKYTVLGGGRRRQAIEELVDEGKEEFRKVPCIISDGKIQGEDTEEEPDEVQELIGKLNIISANSFREKTDWEKMEETLQIGSIIKELKNLGKLKGNVREMQVELSGIKGTQIARYNAIMNHLSLELMQAFKNNDFGISVAYELSRLSDDYQQQAWEIFLENKILTLSDTEKLHNLQKEEEENLKGQMSIEDYPEILPEEEIEEELEGTLPEVQPEKQAEPVAPAQQERNCIHRKGYTCTLTEAQKIVVGDGKNCNEKCCWNCIEHGNCGYECNSSAHREETPQEVRKETEEELQNKYVAPAQQNEEAELQQEVKEELQTEAVKIEQQTEKYEQTTEQTDIELLKEELEKAQRYLTMLSKEFTEKDIRVRKQKLIVGALAGMIAELDNEFPEPVQPPLPKLKNNDQRKEWLREYRSWGIWYKDKHIGVTYYRYQFGNGADLIVEEYENENEYTGTYTSSYFHIVGGPEPPRKNGIPKWTKHEKYSRYPNSETELVEFLKEIQR